MNFKKNLNISNFPFGQVASTFCLPKIHVYRGVATPLVCCSFVLVSMYDLLEDDLGGPLPSRPMSMKSNLRSGVLLPFLFGRCRKRMPDTLILLYASSAHNPESRLLSDWSKN